MNLLHELQTASHTLSLAGVEMSRENSPEAELRAVSPNVSLYKRICHKHSNATVVGPA
jgi:hypothetical protein